MNNTIRLQRLLTLVTLVLFSLQIQDCSKKPKGKQSSATTIPDSLKRYPFRSAIIELRYGGSASGKQMIYIDDYGLKEATIDSLTMKMMDMELPNYKMQIKNGDSLFQIDFVRGIATKGEGPLTASDEKAISTMGEEMAKGMGMKKQAMEEVVAGQKCAVWSSEEMGTKSWLWNNITLKSEAKIGDDKILLEAAAVNVDVPVPAEHFNPPGGIHYTTKEEMQTMLNDIDKKSEKKSEDKKKTN